MRFGYSVNGYGVGDLVAKSSTRSPITQIDATGRRVRLGLQRLRHVRQGRRDAATALREAARIELGMRTFLEDGGFKALHHHLRRPARPEATARPGRAAADGRRLRLRRRGRLEDGGPGPRDEGHGGGPQGRHLASWKTTPITSTPAARRCWALTCWRSAPRSPTASPSLEIHPLGIGGKADPVRLVFNVPPAARPQRLADRHGQSLPPDRQRSGGGPARRRRCRSCRSPASSGSRGRT